MKHARLRRRPVPAAIEGAVIGPGERALLPVPAEEPLDLALCFRSGQIFRWRQCRERWYGPFGGGALALRETPYGIEVEVAGPGVPLAEVYRFLGLDTPI